MSATRIVDGETFARVGALMAVCTVALTATFVGVVGLASGENTAVVSRLPLYVLAGAVTFVVSVLVLEESRHDGRAVLVVAAGVAATGFVLAALGTEGVVYAANSPDRVVASHLFVYLLSAALVASGVGYWSVRNWRSLGAAVSNDHL
jgi:hypothetical protein